jgi:hydroxypyruvate isomerase
VVGIGGELGTKGFNALYGNRIDGVDPAAQDAVAIENLAAAAEAVAAIGGTVLVEPVSGADRYPLRTAADALDVIEHVRTSTGARNLALLADFYHLAVNGDDVPQVIEEHTASFGHIQIADAPGRGAPGTGSLPIDAWIARSHELGYSGYIGLEYKAPIETAFAWAAETVGESR